MKKRQMYKSSRIQEIRIGNPVSICALHLDLSEN